MTTTTAAPVPPGAGAAEMPDEAHRWRAALLAPAVVAVPWLLLALALGLPAPLHGAAGGALVLLVLVTTVTDARWRRIPNWATYTAALWGLGLALVATLTTDAGALRVPFAADPVPLPRLFAEHTIGRAAAGFGVGFGVMFVLYCIFQGGAGDVKLVAALGAFVGPDRVLNVLAFGYILAGAAVACWLVLTLGPGGLVRELTRGMRMQPRPPTEPPILSRKLAMAPFLNAGALLAIFWG